MFKSLRIAALGIVVASLMLSSIGASAQAKPSGKIVVWMQKANQEQIEKTVMPEFAKQYPDIQVEFVNYSPTEVAAQLALAIQGGAGAPDVALMETSQIPRIVDLGGVLDLSDRIKPMLADLAPASLKAGVKDGKYYSFPWDIGPTVLYYRRDIFQAAGLASDPETVSDLVSTWDKFLSVCKTIKAKTNLPCFANNKANGTGDIFRAMLWSQGLGWYSNDGKVTVDSPEAVAALEKLGEFWSADVTNDDLEWTDAWYADLNTKSLTDEKVKPVATIPIAAWMGGFLKNWAAKDTAGLWGVVQYPTMLEGGNRAANQGGSSYVIPEQSKNVEAAWAWLSIANGRDSQLKLFDYGDIFPALLSTYTDPLFQAKDDYFAGQLVRQVYADSAKTIPEANIYGPYFNTMSNAVNTAVQKFATKQLSAKDALAEAAATIRQETGLN